MRRPIEEIIPLTPREVGETPFEVDTDGYINLHTLTFEPTDLADVEALKSEGYIDGYVVRNKLDVDGYATSDIYVHILMSRDQLRTIRETNNNYRLAERGGLRSATVEDLPAFAKRPNGDPDHQFLGVPHGSKFNTG